MVFLWDGLYWIAPYDEEPFEVYCDMTTEGGGWILFSDLTQISGNFGSLPVYAGSFDSGEPGVAPYSLDLDKLHRGDGNTFDIMTWIGEEDVHKLTFLNYTKPSTSFHVPSNVNSSSGDSSFRRITYFLIIKMVIFRVQEQIFMIRHVVLRQFILEQLSIWRQSEETTHLCSICI